MFTLMIFVAFSFSYMIGRKKPVAFFSHFAVFKALDLTFKIFYEIDRSRETGSRNIFFIGTTWGPYLLAAFWLFTKFKQVPALQCSNLQCCGLYPETVHLDPDSHLNTVGQLITGPSGFESFLDILVDFEKNLLLKFT